MLAARQQIYDQDARTVFLNANPGQQAVGQLAETPDGRVYVYSQAGAANLAAGLLTQAPATVADATTQTGTANAIGTTNVTYTLGGTNAITQDQYAGGYLAVTVGPGQNVYRILGNTAISTSAAVATFTIGDTGLTVATTTASKFSLFPHPDKLTVVAAGASSAIPITGVPNVAVTANFYYWSQVGGYASVLSAGAITKNAMAIPSASVSGAATIALAATVTAAVAYAPELTVDTAYFPLVLTIVQ